MEAPAIPQKKRKMSMMALDELKRRDDLESLRKYMIAESCFPAQKDPETSPITMEELKKLTRIWKLNERRKAQDRDEIVAGLLHHASQNKAFLNKKIAASEPHKPTPPTELRPSSAGAKGVLGNVRNFYGLKYFNRDNNPTELVISSRFFSYPNPDDNVDEVVDRWREEDFNMKDDTAVGSAGAHSAANPSNGRNSTASASNTSNSNRHMAGIRSKVKLVKQRNLAMHLMNYSASLDLKNMKAFNVKAVQTFINVAESDDSKTVSHCIIALSNIAADMHVRSILFEINAVHKITNMLAHLRGRAANWAAGLLFYYFSIDKEAEDRVYNASAALLQANGSAKDTDTYLVALYTLNNLMPCIDRQRVAETIMRVLVAHFEPSLLRDKGAMTYLTILINMSWFTNAHATLIAGGVLDLLKQFSAFAGRERAADMGTAVAKVIISFLQLPEAAANIVNGEFINVLIPLIHDSMPEGALVMALKASVVLSSVPALRRSVRSTSLTATIANMVIKKGMNITNVVAKEAAKFFSNITLADPPMTVTSTMTPSAAAAAAAASSFSLKAHEFEQTVDNHIHDAVFNLLRPTQVQLSVKAVAAHALQNVVGNANNAIRLASVCLEPILRFLKESMDQGAAQVIYNLSCIPQCRAELVTANVHTIVLEHFQSAKQTDSNSAIKAVFLQVLVQLSSSNVCVAELLKMDLISKLEGQLKGATRISPSNWKDLSLMLLAVAAYAIKSISMTDMMTIVRILRIICVQGVEDEVVENCAHIVRIISGYYSDFNELDPVIRSILDLGDSEEVIDCVSTMLYNMTCHTANVQLMLADNSYLNTMIRLMRNGKADVQENIIQAISTLCSNEKCTQLLLKHDILSDLIVIALLRTSSEEIKVICSQAFYNMLCHANTRLDLVRGDLWWALMRLGRSDSRIVQCICIRALCDLSYPPSDTLTAGAGANAVKSKVSSATIHAQFLRVQALRKHNILSFMKDLTAGAHQDELLACMHILHNLLNQFVSSDPSTSVQATYDFSENEVINAIRITADAIVRAPDLKTIRIALIVLLKCSQQLQYDKVFSEFLNIDIIDILKRQRNNWNKHPDCRLNVSRLIYDLAKSKIFTKSSSIFEVNFVCMALVEYESESPMRPDGRLSGSLEIIENIAAFFLQFALSENVPASELIALSIWPVLLREGLSTDSTVISNGRQGTISFNAPLPGRRAPSMIASPMKPSGPPSGGPPSGARKTTFNREMSMNSNLGDGTDALRGPNASAFRVQGITMALLAHTIDALLASAAGLSQLTPALLQGLLKVDLVDHIWTRNNLLVVLQAVSQSNHCIPALLSAETFMLMLRFLNSSVGTIRQEKAQEFSASFLRNIVLHSSYISRLIAISNSALNDFVKEVVDEVHSIDAATDLAIFFFNTANYLVQHDSNLNPKFVLDMITALSGNDKLAAAADKDPEGLANITNINKYTLSMILNKYSFQQGVDPSFVQNMLSYMQSAAMTGIPDLMRAVTFKTIADWKSQLVAEFLQVKESVSIDLLVFFPDAAIWVPVCHADCKQVSSIILKFTQPNAIIYDKLEAVEALPLSIFTKIIRQFDPVQDTSAKGDQQAITEAEDGDADEVDGDEGDELDSFEGKMTSAQVLPVQAQVEEASAVPILSFSGSHSHDSEDSSGAHGLTVDAVNSNIRGSLGNTLLATAITAMRITEAEEDEEDEGEILQVQVDRELMERPITAEEEVLDNEQHLHLQLLEGQGSAGHLSAHSQKSQQQQEHEEVLSAKSQHSVRSAGKDMQATTQTKHSKTSEDDYSMNSFEEVSVQSKLKG